MQPVSSVTAFVARYGSDASGDADASAILSELDAEARLVIAAQAIAPGERLAWLAARGSQMWSEAWLRHVEDAAFIAVRRGLQRRGLLRS